MAGRLRARYTCGPPTAAAAPPVPMKKLFACVLVCLSTAAASNVFAAAPCSQFVPDGQFPTLANPRMAPHTRVLCYSDYVVLHSGVTHGPLWSAEHLTRAHVDAAKEMTRTNRFFRTTGCRPAKARRSRTTARAATTAAT